MQVKIFDGSWANDKVEDEINYFLKDIPNVAIRNIVQSETSHGDRFNRTITILYNESYTENIPKTPSPTDGTPIRRNF